MQHRRRWQCNLAVLVDGIAEYSHPDVFAGPVHGQLSTSMIAAGMFSDTVCSTDGASGAISVTGVLSDTVR